VLGAWIAAGGAAGAAARFMIGGWVTTWAHAGFPWATFAINVSGSLLLGYMHRALPAFTSAPHVRAAISVGLCGGFTTFSTFDYEMLRLLQDRAWGTAGAYAVSSVVLCVAGVFAGMALGSRRQDSSSSTMRASSSSTRHSER
jgi:fluoride exporter